MNSDKGEEGTVLPFFLQYEVRPTEKNSKSDIVAGAIATIIVFAENGELARARAGRHVGRNDWEIIEVKRIMLISSHHVEQMDGVLRSVYQGAEQAGIASTFDGWKRSPSVKNK